ncbi:MAG: hypothetical protein IJB76_06415 [Clostridia bacterium]|nr:hypothetical protein [Clostridia bacterium]
MGLEMHQKHQKMPISGLAPNYDNNMALISRGYPSTPKSGDILIRL